ncbi:hypothetical protein XENORESO_017784 [Xenotaenia resolanae]|uniref:Uncharacterized protein n=1 Tax=Xenotaenia resolanae TaxID=208358 RepID=A0ABV0XAE7_9TELE
MFVLCLHHSYIVMLCWFILAMSFLSKLIRSDRAVSTSEQLRQVTVKVTLRIPQWQQGLTSETWYPTEVMTVGFRMQMCTFVYGNSNPKGSVNPNSNYISQGLLQHISLIRDKSTQRADTTRYNPLVITVREMWKNPWPTVNHAELNELVLVLGADVSVRDPLGLFRIQFVDQPKLPDEVLDIIGVSTFLSPTTPPQALVTYLNVSSPEVTLQVETGFSDKNTWLEWITFTPKALT